MPVDITPAVKAAVERLEACEYVLFCDNVDDAEKDEDEYQAAVDQIAAPFCGCVGCVAREAIHASYELIIQSFLDDVISENKNPDTAPCCVVAKRAWKYHIALIDISIGDNDPINIAHKTLGITKENHE